MKKYLTLLTGLFLTFFTLETFAIQVIVRSPSHEVYALGFRLNGNDYGKAGKYYSKSNLPAGTYTFGIRVGGLLIGAKDVGCPAKGKKSVMLNNDATAVLSYNGKTCSASIYQSKK